MILSKIFNRYKNGGILSIINRTNLVLIGYFKTKSTEFINFFRFEKINNRRKRLSRVIYNQAGGIVQYGIFKNMKLQYNSSWGLTDKASMILGFYEIEVINEIFNNSDYRNIFIDIGGADGYYSTGALFSKKFTNCICFESDKKSQHVISQNAKLNGISDNLKILGIANVFTISEVIADLKENIKNSLILCDIEGAEFDLFNDEMLKLLNKAKIIIEIHPWMVENGYSKYEALKIISNKYFTVSELTTSNRDLSIYKELDNFSDNDRWLLCSEGRSYRMKWLVLTPRCNE